MEQESRQSAATVWGPHVLIINSLTGQTAQLFGECSHNDVVLHDVRHLVLHVVLIESDQGIGAGIPNLNERPITPAVYKSILKCIPLHLYIAGQRSAASLS